MPQARGRSYLEKPFGDERPESRLPQRDRSTPPSFPSRPHILRPSVNPLGIDTNFAPGPKRILLIA